MSSSVLVKISGLLSNALKRVPTTESPIALLALDDLREKEWVGK